MGGMCSCWGGETRTVAVSDSAAHGLAYSDVAQLKQCMRKVTGKDQAAHFGLEMFIELFITYPYTRDWFPTFRTSPSQVSSDPQMLAHVVTVMQTIQTYVDYSHEFETMVGLVEKMAFYHLDRAVTTVDMEVFFKIFLHNMKKVLGSRFSSKREKAWTKFLSLHIKIYKRIETDWLQGIDKPLGSQFIIEQLGLSRFSRAQLLSISAGSTSRPLISNSSV